MRRLTALSLLLAVALTGTAGAVLTPGRSVTEPAPVAAMADCRPGQSA